MSKSSTASGSKATPLPTRSAWSKGPPSSSSTPRSQSPAPSTPTSATTPNATSHTRRPSALGPSVAVKDGVSIPKGNAASIRGSASPVTFGSIDDAQAPLSTSPATAPILKLSEGVKSFGSVAAAAATGGPGHANGKASVSSNSSVKPAAAITTPASTAAPSSSSASTSTPASTSSSTPTSTSTTTTPSKPHNFDVRKMFQGSSSSAPSQPPAPPTYPSSASSSPAVRNTSLPPPASPHQPPSQLGQHSYTFVPGRQSNFGSGPGQPPRSPVHNRNMQNGAPRAAPGPSSATPPVQPGMPSPRPSHPPQPGMPPPPGPPTVPMQGWYPNYYDPSAAYYGWYMPPPGSLPPQGMPHYPGPTPPSGMPLSPRNPQPQLHPAPQPPPPGTPTAPHAIPAPAPIPPAASPHLSSAPASVTSPPSTPASTTTNITSPGANASRLNTGASAFVPGGRKALVIKSPEGVEVDVKSFKPTKVEPAVVNTSQNRRSIRLETEEARQKRLAEEQEKERLAKAKVEAAKQEKEKKEREEKEAEERRLKAEEDARKAKEEAERLERERLKKEEEERDAARRKAEEEEKERERLRLEEEARKAEEEKERLRKEEEDARRKEEEAAREAEKEKERLRLLEEEKAKAAAAEEEAKVKAAAAAAATASEPEEGEVVEAPADLSASVSDKSKDLKDGLRIDTSPSPLDMPRRRPGPLDLSYTKNKTDVPAPLPSALATARVIEDLDSIKYPTGILSPSIDNTNARNGKFRYDRDFLLQFMSICKEKPDMLPPLDAIGLEPADQTFNITRGGSGRHRQSSNAPLPPGMTRQNSVGLGISGSGFGGKGNQFSMGNFGAPTGAKLTSDDRFQISNRATSISGSPASFNRALPMTRTTSQGGSGSGRTRSKRGTQREPHKPSHTQHNSAAFPSTQSPAVGANNLPMEPVVPLQVSENRWVASSASKKPAVDIESPEVVDKKVKGLLNKLTMEKFDSLSDQIIDWANKSEKEKNGQTLIQVIRLVFEKATDEAAWSEMYARLCRKMMEQISPRVQDEGIQNAEGKPIAGGQLFRKYLLNRCQEDFERGWSVREAAAAAAASKQGQDEAAQKEATASGESALYSEEYYAAQKAKRQGLGLVKFIGELFKLSMLTERIMHECIKKLLGNVENPEEDDIESLCKLLTTVGPQLDTPKARNHMDIYFSRIRDMTKPGAKVSSRMQFMLLDVLELRERKWIARNQVAAPTTIAQVHEAAAKEKAASSEALQRNSTMSRTNSRRGHDRGESSQVDPNGWTTAGSGPARPSRVGDLSNFGKISKSNAMTFGPSSIFAGGKKGDAKSGTQSLSRQSSINMFSALTQHTDSAEPEAAKPTEPPQRRKLNLLPRTKTLEDKPPATASEPPSEEEESAAPTSISEADAKKKIEEDVKEFFAIRNLEEAEVYFTALPAEHHFRLIDKLVTVAVERKIDDAQLVADLFKHITSKNLCSESALEDGLTPTIEILGDIAIDVPKAFDLMAIMIKGTPLVSDEEKKTKLVSKCMDDSDKLLALLS